MALSLPLLLTPGMKCDRVLVLLFVTIFALLEESLSELGSENPACTTDMTGVPACNLDGGWCGVYTTNSMDDGGLLWDRTTQVTVKNGGKGIERDWQPRKSGRGQFAYLDVGNADIPIGSKARLNGKIVNSEVRAVCIQFHYATTTSAEYPTPPTISIINHMEYDHDHLIGVVKNDTKGQWTKAEFHSCVGRLSTISFESQKLSDNSLVGLDYLKITKSDMDCSKFTSDCTNDMTGLPSCNFNGGLCGNHLESMEQSGLEWKRVKTTAMIASDWGPKSQGKGSFLYLDANKPNIPIASKARLNGQISNPAVQAVCVELHYAISTNEKDKTPIIRIINVREDGKEHIVEEVSGDTQGKWREAQMHFCVEKLSTISFESQKVSHNTSVGLDYIKITKSNIKCITPTTVPKHIMRHRPSTAKTKATPKTITTPTASTSTTTSTISTSKTTRTTSTSTTTPKPSTSTMTPTTSTSTTTPTTSTSTTTLTTSTSITTPTTSTSTKTTIISTSTTTPTTSTSTTTPIPSTSTMTPTTSTSTTTPTTSTSTTTPIPSTSTMTPTTSISTMTPTTSTSTTTPTTSSSTMTPITPTPITTPTTSTSTTTPISSTSTMTPTTSTSTSTPTTSISTTTPISSTSTTIPTASTTITTPTSSTLTATPTSTSVMTPTTSTSTTIPLTSTTTPTKYMSAETTRTSKSTTTSKITTASPKSINKSTTTHFTTPSPITTTSRLKTPTTKPVQSTFTSTLTPTAQSATTTSTTKPFTTSASTTTPKSTSIRTKMLTTSNSSSLGKIATPTSSNQNRNIVFRCTAENINSSSCPHIESSPPMNTADSPWQLHHNNFDGGQKSPAYFFLNGSQSIRDDGAFLETPTFVTNSSMEISFNYKLIGKTLRLQVYLSLSGGKSKSLWETSQALEVEDKERWSKKTITFNGDDLRTKVVFKVTRINKQDKPENNSGFSLSSITMSKASAFKSYLTTSTAMSTSSSRLYNVRKDKDTDTKDGSSTPIIAGCVVGIVVLVTIVASILIVRKRRGNNALKKEFSHLYVTDDSASENNYYENNDVNDDNYATIDKVTTHDTNNSIQLRPVSQEKSNEFPC